VGLNIIFPYPLWFILICLAGSALFSWILYHRELKFSSPSWLRYLLAFFRFAAVFIISLLLLTPLIRNIQEDVRKPIVIIAEDKSGSVSDVMSEGDLKSLNENIENLSAKLSENYDVRRVSFGSAAVMGEGDSTLRHSTNISDAMQYISNNFSDQNLGAVIMSTDGIYNEGANPLYTKSEFKAPLFTIALGDTIQKKDLSIRNIYHNKIAYLGDKFTIQADIAAYNCNGSNTRLTLEQITGTQVRALYNEQININSGDFFTTRNIVLDANITGVVKYRMKLSTVRDEVNIVNNTRDFFIEILDARQKILLLAHAPHPDLSALKQIITENRNYEVSIAYVGEGNIRFADFSLVVFHNLPSEINDIKGIATQLANLEIPSIYIVGAQIATDKFNAVQNVVNIRGNSKNTEEIQGELNPVFSMFTTSDLLKAKLKTFPPLIAPFGEYSISGTGNVYIYQSIKKIKTNYPLIAFGEINGVRTGIICGEGIWKWRIFDFLQHSNYDLITEIVNKTIQLVSVKSDKRKFRVSASANIYRDNDNILLDAQLYNDSYELINEPDVAVIIKNEKGDEYKYTFSKTQNYYTLNAGLFPEGSYSFNAAATYNGRQLTASGKFQVESVQLEQYDLTARHSLLKGLSEKYNGLMVYPSQTDSIARILLEEKPLKSVMYQSTVTHPVINLKWLFFVILLFISVEWFIRRYFGAY
jgi:hypothetical protein